MDEFARRISIQTAGTSNVLMIELQENETLIPYCCKIMENNNIPGLLQMRHQTMDGIVSLRYNIGGKVRLHEFMMQHHLTYQNGILLLRNLSGALLRLNEYFLSIDMCYLDPEQIYIGDGLQAYLPCVPVDRKEGQNSAARLKHFYEKLLSEYFATADCSSYDDMFKWVYKVALFDLETFYHQFLQEEKTEPRRAKQLSRSEESSAVLPERSERPLVEQAAGKEAEESGAHELTEMLQGKMKGVQALYPGAEEEESGPLRMFKSKSAEKVAIVPEAAQKSAAFCIPGGEPVEISSGPKAPKRTQNKPTQEKKGFKLFGSRSAKEAGKAQKTEEEPLFPFPAPDVPKNQQAKPKRDKKVRPEPTQPPREEQWQDGTIMVGQDSAVPQPRRFVGRPTGAYFLHNGQKVVITETPFLVGKYNTTCHLHYAIYDNNKISRSHATFLTEKGRFFIRDNQSRNGTLLNGKPLLPLQPAPLKDGDEIKLYDEVLIFHVE